MSQGGSGRWPTSGRLLAHDSSGVEANRIGNPHVKRKGAPRVASLNHDYRGVMQMVHQFRRDVFPTPSRRMGNEGYHTNPRKVVSSRKTIKSARETRREPLASEIAFARRKCIID